MDKRQMTKYKGNGYKPPFPIVDELEEAMAGLTREQRLKKWEDAKPKIKMMKPKDKAIQLVDNFNDNVSTHHVNMGRTAAIDCARIAVTEIIAYALPYTDSKYFERELKFWQDVRKEIEKL